MTPEHRIDNDRDIIDSRDIIARIDYLQDDRQPADDGFYAELTEDEQAELVILRAVDAEGEYNAPEWHHGETLIRDSHFEDYARELAEDIGVIDPKATWPTCHIDWEAAADALKADYTRVDFDGIDYWIRS